jgi:hypothetical protein
VYKLKATFPRSVLEMTMEAVAIIENSRQKLEEILASDAVEAVPYEVRTLVEEASITLASVRQYLIDPVEFWIVWQHRMQRLGSLRKPEHLVKLDLTEAAAFVAQSPRSSSEGFREPDLSSDVRCA